MEYIRMGNRSSKSPSITPLPVVGSIAVTPPSGVDHMDHSAFWPDPASIHSPAYLVVGGGLDKEVERRAFYDDSEYYILDRTDPPQDLLSRYIRADFNNWRPDKTGILDKVYQKYKQKFDIVIFDSSVFKFIDNSIDPVAYIAVISRLKQMIKPGGYLIIDTDFTYTGNEITGTSKTDQQLIKHTQLESNGGPIPEVKTVTETADETVAPIVNKVVAAIYRSHPYVVKPYRYIIQQKKQLVEGGRRRSRTLRNKRKRLTRRRRA